MAGVDIERLRREMGGASPREMPRSFRHAGLAYRNLAGPLSFIPLGTLVSMKIEVPDNQSGKQYGLVWRCAPVGLTPEQARAEICEQLVDTFLNLTMPLPR